MSESAATTRQEVPAWRRVIADTITGGRISLILPVAMAVVLVLFPILVGGNVYWIREFSLIAVLALVVSGVNLSFGYAGEVQFGQVFMFALGGYLTSVMAVRGFSELIPLLLIGGAAAAIVGGLVAIPAVRIGGITLGLTSFFLVLVIPDLLNLTTGYTGGAVGLVGIPLPKMFGHTLTHNGLFEVCAVCLILWLALFRNLVTSRYGVIFRVLRESPVLTASLGFSTPRLKAVAYSMGAFPAGLAGCLFGFLNQVLGPQSFDISLAIGVVAASVLGGVEGVYTAVIGAAILQLGPEDSLAFQQYATIVFGLFLIFAAVVLRNGMSGIGKAQAARLARKLRGTAVHIGDDDALSVATTMTLSPRNGDPLRIDGVSKSFGGVHALRDVTLGAEPGVITALIGSNGSGKTTLLNVICGYETPDTGTVRLADRELTGHAPHQVARVGVGRTFQIPSVPRGVSVLDVVASGRYRADPAGLLASILRLPRYWRAQKADREEALALLDLVGLVDLAREEAGELSLGTRRLVEVARALCAEPGLLLLDEPASGLSEAEVERLGQVIKAAAAAGTTVILIEHNFRFVTGLADVAHVLHLGELIATGPAATIGENQAVIESYLGAAAGGARPPRSSVAVISEGDGGELAAPRVQLELVDAFTGYGDLQVLRGLSMTLYEGAVEVLLGRNGVGKTTTLGAISGERRLWQGKILLDGSDITGLASYKRASAGISLVQENKRIFRNRTVLENLQLGTYTEGLSRQERAAICDTLLDRFPMLKPRISERAGGLSGGQQQMLAIAQALASQPRVLLLDEPSAGLAPTIIAEVFEQISQLRSEGMTILLVEQLAEQALAVADHVTVMDNGAIVTSGPPEQFADPSDLQEAYFGHTTHA